MIPCNLFHYKYRSSYPLTSIAKTAIASVHVFRRLHRFSSTYRRIAHLVLFSKRIAHLLLWFNSLCFNRAIRRFDRFELEFKVFKPNAFAYPCILRFTRIQQTSRPSRKKAARHDRTRPVPLHSASLNSCTRALGSCQLRKGICPSVTQPSQCTASMIGDITLDRNSGNLLF